MIRIIPVYRSLFLDTHRRLYNVMLTVKLKTLGNHLALQPDYYLPPQLQNMKFLKHLDKYNYIIIIISLLKM